MGNVSVFDIKNGGNAVAKTTGLNAAAASQTVPCGRDARLVLRVCNAGEEAIVVRLAAGDGPRAPLGPKDIAVGPNQTAYIALFDTARHKTLANNEVGVALLDGDGDALSAEVLAQVGIEALRI